jgi:hypothetical protein
MREKYWNYYTRTKYELLYFYEYLNDSYRWLRYLDSFLAVVSCSSIAAWAVWNELPMLWAVIIAASQVVSAVKQFLPYGKRIQALNELIPRLDMVLNRIDYSWFKVENGELTDDQINDLIYSFKKECADMSNKYLTGVYFPERVDLSQFAQSKTECFFECF